MNVIGDLLARDLRQKIEEIIKVDQTNEQVVYTEITEYIATDRIRDQYTELFRAIADAPSEPHEGIGVWISGFFGSGKSSFAKNVGYVLANRDVLDRPASRLFAEQVHDQHVAQLVEFINHRIPTEVIMFDVSVDRAVKRSTERIAEIMYTVLLRELDYAEDYDIAELEIELEGRGMLDTFMARYAERYPDDWRKGRKGALKISEASTVLHDLDRQTFPDEETWARSLHGRSTDITVGRFVERAFELCARRRPGKALTFIIDEVGQYVARSADKIEDLRAVVEAFGRTGRNLLKAGKIVAPAWIMVTSQEKLNEIVAALDSKRVELARLQDRFKYHIDLSPADIREVATRRVLAKKEEAVPLLKKLFRESQGQLTLASRLERTARSSEITEDDFVQFYPYLPHFIELSIDIMSGIRLQPGAPKHLGGSNRTIIKQAYEMLVSERTHMASRPIGTLVTLDKIFDLVEGNLPTEKQKDVNDIRERFKNDADDHGMTARVAKVLCLLEFVRDLPRTEANIAACLVDAVGKPAPLAAVQQALQKLETAQFVRNTEEGWKLQTAQEKNWESERRGLAPKARDRNEILRESLQAIFADPKLKTYKYRQLKTFRVGITVEGVQAGDKEQLQLSILSADDEDLFPSKLAETRGESRQPGHSNDLYWVFALTHEIDALIVNLYASRQMVNKYSQLRAQHRISPEEGASLSNEQNEAARYQKRLEEKLEQSLERGQGLFRGVSKEASSLGKTLSEIRNGFFDASVPDLYPKLEMGMRHVNANEAEEVLKAANLQALPQVFYGGEQGLNLVVQEDGKWVFNPSADVAKEIMDYIRHEHAYGNKVTGKSLEDHFGGVGYGWERDMLRLVLAVLLRAGAIEVTYQGRRYRNHQDPQCRVPLTNNVAFRAASFAPRESVGLKTLTTAVQHYAELTGEEIDVEEGAITTAFKKLAEEEREQLLPVAATVEANHLPLSDIVDDYRHTVESIFSAESDDCVRILSGEGASFKEARDKMRAIRQALSEANLNRLREARRAVADMWSALAARKSEPELRAKAEELRTLIQSPSFYEQLDWIASLAQAIATVYRQEYIALHIQRTRAFDQAIEDIKGRPEWIQLDEAIQATVLSPLSSRVCKNEVERQNIGTMLFPAKDLYPGEDLFPGILLRCRYCDATIGQIESDIAALDGLKSQVIAQIQSIIAPEEHVERVRLSTFFTGTFESKQEIDDTVERLREYLLKLLAEGVKIILE
jgi:hypothetical protein